MIHGDFFFIFFKYSIQWEIFLSIPKELGTTEPFSKSCFFIRFLRMIVPQPKILPYKVLTIFWIFSDFVDKLLKQNVEILC